MNPQWDQAHDEESLLEYAGVCEGVSKSPAITASANSASDTKDERARANERERESERTRDRERANERQRASERKRERKCV